MADWFLTGVLLLGLLGILEGKNNMPTRVGVLPGDKTPDYCMRSHNKKPSLTLGQIISILMIIKLALAILHLLK
jgi:hypothetical protein